jgi:hypothetical protein
MRMGQQFGFVPFPDKPETVACGSREGRSRTERSGEHRAFPTPNSEVPEPELRPTSAANGPVRPFSLSTSPEVRIEGLLGRVHRNVLSDPPNEGPVSYSAQPVAIAIKCGAGAWTSLELP